MNCIRAALDLLSPTPLAHLFQPLPNEQTGAASTIPLENTVDSHLCGIAVTSPVTQIRSNAPAHATKFSRRSANQIAPSRSSHAQRQPRWLARSRHQVASGGFGVILAADSLVRRISGPGERGSQR